MRNGSKQKQSNARRQKRKDKKIVEANKKLLTQLVAECTETANRSNLTCRIIREGLNYTIITDFEYQEVYKKYCQDPEVMMDLIFTHEPGKIETVAEQIEKFYE